MDFASARWDVAWSEKPPVSLPEVPGHKWASAAPAGRRAEELGDVHGAGQGRVHEPLHAVDGGLLAGDLLRAHHGLRRELDDWVHEQRAQGVRAVPAARD